MFQSSGGGGASSARSTCGGTAENRSRRPIVSMSTSVIAVTSIGGSPRLGLLVGSTGISRRGLVRRQKYSGAGRALASTLHRLLPAPWRLAQFRYPPL